MVRTMTFTQIRKHVARKLADASALICVDSVGLRSQDGTIRVKQTYFYRHGRSAESFAAQVAAVLGDEFTVTGEDHWNAWPKDSYFLAIVRVK